MPRYTVLVIANQPPGTTAPLGKISAVQKGDGVWGRKEGPPRFAKIAVDMEEDAVRVVMRLCSYDFETEQFRHTKSSEVFDDASDVIRKTSNFSGGHERDALLVRMLIHEPSGSDCNDLLPPWLSDPSEMRRYWWDRWYLMRKLPGGKELLETVRYGTFADTRTVFRAMSQINRSSFLLALTEEEQRYLKATCLAETKDEYRDFLAGRETTSANR